MGGDSAEFAPRQVGPFGIADQHLDAARLATPQEGHHPQGERGIVEQVADHEEVYLRWWILDDIGGPGYDIHAVDRRVEADRGNGIGIDVDRRHRGGSGLRRRNGDEPRAGAEIEDTATHDYFRPVEQIAGKHGAAGPGIGPIRCRIGFSAACKPPEPACGACRMKPDLGNGRNG
ncbi:hypothetical protein BAE36_27130 [Rhizobium leguminosarum bv. trifolii]|uniref:Uncharacterized protein n=1 Tax=Rhizobium leguminosarum bv. trifolii TaxID=386 RepID=A0A1B8R5U5_RHILT|nr:hypothetical protein [Rhizobium leguminosarum bv. trifolii]OBY04164.1 hypothetical protein BAE36_27130 [Rhizobium leguminosarum bv. trifolii]